MIRINLLAADRPTKKAAGGGGASAPRTPSAPGGATFYLFLFLFAGGAAAVCTGMYFLITQEIKRLDTDIANAKAEEQRLQAIKKKIEEFQAKKKMYEEKVALIERLRAEQSGPVHLLDEVSKALPDFLWLTDFDQKGPSLTIKGEATGMPAVAELVANLQRSGWFPTAEPQTYTAGNVSMQFQLGATFQDPAIAAKAKAAAEAARAKAGAPAGAPGAPGAHGAPGAAPGR